MPVHENEWLITKAVVRGKGHIDRDVSCQDFCEVETSADGKWLVAVVTDGAGTASKAGEGAQIVAQSVARGLILELQNIEQRGPGVWLRDRVRSTVIDVRERLRGTSSNIRDYSCTMVGVLVGPSGGFIFHVGDGAALASRASRVEEIESKPAGTRLWSDIVLSEPENGEYANETFFITQEDWEKHLRFTALNTCPDIVALMSDGAMPFVIQRRQPHSPFIDPVIANLLQRPDRAQRDTLLHGYFAAADTYPITSDDKTLFVALRRTLTKYAGQAFIPESLDEVIAAKSSGRLEAAGGADRETQRGDPQTREKSSIVVAEIADYRHIRRLALFAIFTSGVALLIALGSLTLGALVYLDRHPIPKLVPPSQKPADTNVETQTLAPVPDDQAPIVRRK